MHPDEVNVKRSFVLVLEVRVSYVVGPKESFLTHFLLTLLFKLYNSIGFQTGSVFWDDEDDNNANGYGGVLPSGDFGRNTRINYCCRFVS